MTGTDFFLKTLITKVAQLLRSAACLQKNQSRSYLNHLVLTMHGPINVNSSNNTSKWRMGFNSAFKGLTESAYLP
jgi:hypothetical protein